jgi:Peptidase family M1 domain
MPAKPFLQHYPLTPEHLAPRHPHIAFLLLLCTLYSNLCSAQPSAAAERLASAQAPLPVPRNIRQAYDKGTRTVTGAPGPHYWENHADYSIKVSFDPRTRLVSGTESITYNNSSPDTLRQLLFKLYPNLYKKGAQRMMPIKPDDLSDGVTITNLNVEGQPKPAGTPSGRRGADGTDMFISIPALTPGQQTHVSLGFSYTLNKTSHIRTGQVDSGSFFIAYFFPRIAVYDDIDGWNRIPYLGPQEFYNDFCNFSVDITVPGDYQVWATGDLTNRQQVLADVYNQRIDQANTGDATVTVIDSTDLARKGITRNADSNTWKFQASNVTDFVFALSDHYMWKASSLVVDPQTGRRTRVDAVFNPVHKDFFEVVDFARTTVSSMSYIFPAWPYPYPHETVFDGLDQMEYPMMVNDNPLDNRADAIELTDHEIFHTLFPFYMGVNETKYAWMDEGWATIGEWIISPIIDSTLVDGFGVVPYGMAAGKEEDLPIITLSTQEEGNDYYFNSYPKPGLGYLYVKDLLGDSLFTRALHRYISDWHGKHPIPLDFFGSINAGSGRNLNWFWKRWFYDGGYPDLAIKGLQHAGLSGHTRGPGAPSVLIANKGGKPIPIDLTIEFTDSTIKKIHRPVDVWEKGNTEVSIPVGSSKPIRKITLGSTYTPDSYPADNQLIVH